MDGGSPLQWKNNQTEMSKRKLRNVIRKLIFLGAFTKLRKVTVSFFMSVRLLVRMHRLGSQWMDFHEMDFHEIWYLNIFRKSVDKIKGSLKSGKNIW